MSAATQLERTLRASVSLAHVEGRLAGIAQCIEDEAAEREEHGHGDDVLRFFGSELRDVLRDLERFPRQVRAIEGRA